MLQEITENDLEYIRGGLSRKNLLEIYNVIRKHQKEIENLEYYYFDKKFVWNMKTVPKRSKPFLIEACNIYGWGKDMTKRIEDYYLGVVRKFLNQEQLGDRYDNYQLGVYLRELFNKLRPEEEYFKNSLNPRAQIEIKGEREKYQQQEKMRQAVKTKEEKEAEAFQAWNNDQIANQKVKPNKVKVVDAKIKDKAFIYAIYIDGELAYIGKTIRALGDRLGEHLEWSLLQNGGGNQQDYLYKAMRECKIGYKFKVMYESHNVISNHELEEIEKALIENLQPKFNYEGVKVPYRFTEEKGRS